MSPRRRALVVATALAVVVAVGAAVPDPPGAGDCAALRAAGRLAAPTR